MFPLACGVPMRNEGQPIGEVITGQNIGFLRVTSPDTPNGKVVGNDISFDVDFNGNTITHKGKIEGKEIKLKVNGFGAEWDLVMKRPAK